LANSRNRISPTNSGEEAINPADRTITEVDVPNPNKSLQGLYDLIGCDLVQLVELDRGIILCCDEEGKLKPVTGAFTFFGNEELVIAGNAVILGGDASRFGKLHENIASFEQIVEWVNPGDVPEPEFTFIPLTEKGFENARPLLCDKIL